MLTRCASCGFAGSWLRRRPPGHSWAFVAPPRAPTLAGHHAHSGTGAGERREAEGSSSAPAPARAMPQPCLRQPMPPAWLSSLSPDLPGDGWAEPVPAWCHWPSSEPLAHLWWGARPSGGVVICGGGVEGGRLWHCGRQPLMLELRAHASLCHARE